MWIVRLALRRPYTVVVMALCILLGGAFTVARMPTDIFPEVDIPVIGVVWQYGGMMPEELANRVTGNYGRALTTTVNGIEHIESQTVLGVAVIKVFFHPSTHIGEAIAQVTGISQTLLKQFPPGITPPLIMQYSASNVPVMQAKAQAEQARTQRELARTTKARDGALQPSGYVSTQDFEDKSASFDVQRANVSAAEANVASADANVKKYQELKSFSVVTAPSDGVVTSRTTENGQLVNAGSNAGQALFKVAKVDVMRMFINVPQSYAPSVKVGQDAHVNVREFPGRAFSGKVERTARELDAATRTLLTEVRIKNDDGALISGMYAQVQLDMQRTEEPLLVPATALSVTAQGTRMAIVQNGVIAWKVVRVENDLGDKIAISGGLAPTDDVVVLPGEKLVEGLKVSAEEQPPR